MKRFFPVQTLPNGSNEEAPHNRREAGPESEKVEEPTGDGGYGSMTRTPSMNTEFGNAAVSSSASGSALTLLEAALEAWADCQPDGYVLPEDAVKFVLPAVSCRVPGAYESPGTSQMLNELFTAGLTEDGQRQPAVFEQMLKPHNGQVHFLYFWSAFSKAARLLASNGGRPDSDLGMAGGDESLTLELETLRDSILRLIETGESQAAISTGADNATPSTSSSPSSTPTNRRSRSKDISKERSISTEMLMQSVQATASMSSSPDFWHEAEVDLTKSEHIARLTMEGLTVVILSWLRDAIAWQNERAVLNEAPAAEVPSSSIEDFKDAISDEKEGEIPVYVHIYDVSQEETVQKVNRWLASKNSLLKFGGIFHAGVEVNGLEWSFGMSMCETLPGISCVEPKTHPAHHYRQTVKLRSTKFSAEEIADLISRLIEEYPGDDYDLLRRNCCHFADDFCRRLGAGRIPGWIHRLSRVGARVDSALQLVTGRKLINLEESDED